MGTVDLAGPAGRLEALLEEVPSPRFAALVCHPHPRYGGTMHEHATYRLARAVRAAGGTSLRFNFRGVGRSAGAYDQGRGEADDAAAALAWLATRHGALPRLACGFSFGALAAVAAAGRDAGAAGLLLAGLPVVERDDLPRELARLRGDPRRAAVIQGELDEFGAPAAVRAALEGSAGERLVLPIEGATHLFAGRLDELEAAATGAARWVLEGARGGPGGPGAPATGAASRGPGRA